MNKIDEATVDYVGILAKLELSDEQKLQAASDMERMLDYIDEMNEIDTSDVQAMSHVSDLQNVFREDEVMDCDGSEAALANAPEQKDGAYKVPRTF